MRLLHMSPDGVARPCRIKVAPCPYAEHPGDHFTLADMATSGGGPVDLGSGPMEVSGDQGGFFTVKGPVRTRWYTMLGRRISGMALRGLKRHLRGRSKSGVEPVVDSPKS